MREGGAGVGVSYYRVLIRSEIELPSGVLKDASQWVLKRFRPVSTHKPIRSWSLRQCAECILIFGMRALRQLHHGLLLRAVGAVVILLVFLNVWLWHSRSSSTSVLSDDVPPDQKEDQLCAEFTGSDRVLVTVKTGATEANLKIPIQLSTSLRCAPNVLIFSDMVQEIGDHHVYDALENIPDEVTANNSDFDIYRMQQELKDPQKVIEQLSSMRDPRMPEDLAAWTLDKYKNIHIVEEAWKLQPNKDWYFHIDADTYVVWPTLLQWIQKLDPSMESFIGSMAYVIGLPFAHGGSGMLMSRAVVQNLVVKHNGTAAKWDYSMHENCCGDWVLAQALKEYGIDVKNAWPVINGETASTIPFAEDHWCQPLVTMHHLTPLDFEQLGRFELQRPNKAVCDAMPVSIQLQPLTIILSIGSLDICRALQRPRFRSNSRPTGRLGQSSIRQGDI